MLFDMYETLMSPKIVANAAHTGFKMQLTSLHTLFIVFLYNFLLKQMVDINLCLIIITKV